jgi:hypothetical protein
MSWFSKWFASKPLDPIFKERILLSSLVVNVMDAETMKAELKKRGLDPKWSSFCTQYDLNVIGVMKDGKIIPDDTRLAHEMKHLFSLINPQMFRDPDKEDL